MREKKKDITNERKATRIFQAKERRYARIQEKEK